MTDRKNISLRLKIAAGFCAILMLCFAAVFVFQSGPHSAKSEPALFETALKGFAPGSLINFRIYGSDGYVQDGQVSADDHGKARLPAYAYKDIPPDLVTYDLSVDRKNKSDDLDIIVLLDHKNDQARITSHGLNAFADVILETPAQSLNQKADWAGIYKDDHPLGLSGLKKETGTLKLAFFDGGIQSDARVQNPYMIEIILAPGGGGPTSDGVNDYDEFNCGEPERSGCTPNVRDQLNTLVQNYVVAFQKMAAQLSASMMDYVFIVGTFFDAGAHLDTQRELQALQAQAHKDYHPSQTMCEFGSFVRSVARSEEKAKTDKLAASQIMMAYYTGQEHTSTADGLSVDMESRAKQFREIYCDPADNANGLDIMCQHEPSDALQDGELIGGSDKTRLNKDIDYVRALYGQLSVDVNFTDQAETHDEKDLLALSRHLYWPKSLAVANPDVLIDLFPDYQNARRLFATQNVAHNSFLEMIALKASSADGVQEQSGWNFMKALLKDFGLADDEIHEYLGDYPSYYAQMEVLTKKIYQNPDFYTSLYDKPANVDRINVALDAFRVMQMRDMYDSHLRKELLTSLVLEQAIAKHAEGVQATLEGTAGDLRFQ